MEKPFARGDGIRGYGFPMTRGREGYWPRRSPEALRKTSLLLILGTYPGERVMEPTFGSRLRDRLFSPNDATQAFDVTGDVRDAVATWDPFARIISSAIEQEGDQIKLFIDYVDLRSPNEDRGRVSFSI